MKKSEDTKKVVFDGKFTARLRELLRRRRQELGLSYASLSGYFNVNWSTLRKWELGPTSHCGVSMRPLLGKFLNGELDENLRQMQSKYRFSAPTRYLPSSVQSCLERIGNTYRLCQNRPELKCRLIEELSAKTGEILDRLVTPPRYLPKGGASRRGRFRRPRQSSENA